MYVHKPDQSHAPSNEVQAHVWNVHSFKRSLHDMGFCPLQVSWRYEEYFASVPEALMSVYLKHMDAEKRKGLVADHAIALQLAKLG